MATDIKTTNERIRVLYSAAATLRRCAQQCKDTQNYHDNCTDFANRAPNVEARMAAIQDMITAVSNELAELASDANMAFQFEWVAGRNSIDDIYVLSGSQLAIRNNGSYVASAFMNGVSTGDVVALQGAAANSALYTIVSTNVGAGTLFANFHGNETLLSRVIKEMKGE